MRKPRFGVNLPNVDVENKLPSAQEILGFARAAEDSGFASLWVLDKIMHPSALVLEPLTLLSYISSATSKVAIGSAIIVASLRNPLILAKSLTTIDYLSGGRLILGIGGGAVEKEFFASGIELSERGKRLEESLRLIKKLWTEQGEVNFQSEFRRVESSRMLPLPLKKPHPPIWIGANPQRNESETSLKRVARLGDGYIGAGTMSLEDWKYAWDKVSKFLKEETKKDLNTFSAAKRVYLFIDQDKDKAKKKVDYFLKSFYAGRVIDSEKTCVYGSSTRCVEKLAQYIEVGVEEPILHPVSDYSSQLKLCINGILPSF